MNLSSKTLRPARVLVVDDERHIARLMEFVLRKEGYEVFVAHDGAQALALAEQQQPDAVLLDLVLPDTSGLEILARLRACHSSSAIPIGLLSARSFESANTDFNGSEASFHCTKPVAPSTLIKKLLDAGVPPLIDAAAR
jgi:DNA-binding response OmpR family regulator